ncbi:MAG: sigma-70 family RNA polymerase sigma factor [Clostridia bacterium]|nr:sigma-70 family RNA polymerase sigma factor [Clostridia bacterium]
MTDKELLKKLKKDKSSGLSAVIDLYSGLLYKVAGAIILPVGTKEDVEECVSDSFLAFYNAIDGFDIEKSSIKTYLALITRRKAIDLYRSLKGKSQKEQDFTYESLATYNDFTPDLDRKTSVLPAVKSLGEPDSTIIIRKYIFGETAAEISASLGLSEGAVQKRIERSCEKLRKNLGGVLNG